jgi:CRP/FNR family transcriptional regulator, cyclic AMP receptor protein
MESLLRQVPLFTGLDEESLRLLSRRSRRRRFASGHTLFCQGDPGHTLYVVIAGRVNIERLTASGERLHITHRLAGEVFGEMAVIDGKPRMADAVTAGETELLMLDRDDFLSCLRQSPEIAVGIIACLSERLREAADLLESHLSRDVLGRVSVALLEWAGTHGAPGPDGEVRIATRFTQQALAEQIGASRESVNRALSSLKAVGAVRLDGRQLVLLDTGRLRRYSDR